MRISIKDLQDYMVLDPYYGATVPGAKHPLGVVRTIIDSIYVQHRYDPVFTRFRERWSQSFLSAFAHQHHLACLWFGLMGLRSYVDGKATNWKGEEFISRWAVNFEVDRSELKQFLRDQRLPLPAHIFPEEPDNTARLANKCREELVQIRNLLDELQTARERLNSLHAKDPNCLEKEKTVKDVNRLAIEAEWAGGKLELLVFAARIKSSENIASASTSPSREKTKSLPHGAQSLIGFQLDRDHWSVTFSGQTEIVKTTDGMHYYKYLIDHPWKTFSGLKLVKQVFGKTPDNQVTDEEAEQSGLAIIEDTGDSGGTIDEKAKAEYNKDLERIERDKDIANTTGNKDRVKELENEEDFIRGQLAKDLNIHGKPRFSGNPNDKARSTVTHALDTANKNIAKVHPELARHLRDHTKTGNNFSFQPDPPDSPGVQL